jgi:Lectin C-type domain
MLMKSVQFFLILFAAILLIISATPCRAQVLAGPIINPGNGHAYYLLDHTNATTLEAEAVTLGGHLATIRDTNENHWVSSTFIPLAGNMGVVIGLTDFENEGKFVWFSGETNGYRNWNAGEPSNSGNEDYVTIRAQDEQWNDIAGADHYGVAEVLVRETNAVPLVVVQPVAGAALGLSWLTVTNQLYEVQSVTFLGGSNWASFGPYIYGDGNFFHLTDSTTNSVERFYRVIPVR